jgi:hypothetical protein
VTHLTVLAWGQKIYAPGVKVTLDLASALAPLGTKVSAILVEPSPETEQEARRRLGGAPVRACRDLGELPQLVKSLGSDVVYSKDHIDSLEALIAVKRASGARTLAFTSGFHALDSLRPPPPSDRAPRRSSARLGRILPFPRATRHYRELLGELDGVVAISFYCEMLLELLYGVRPRGVVYPVVDPASYSPPSGNPSRKGILVYVGPADNRDAAEFVPCLRALPAAAGPIHLFGNSDGTEAVARALGSGRSTRHVDLAPADLVALYRSVRWTYITSEWEGFGYVGPESLLCGAPVVTEVAQPWMEIPGESEAVRIASGELERTELLSSPPLGVAASLSDAQVRLRAALSPAAVGRRFHALLEQL